MKKDYKVLAAIAFGGDLFVKGSTITLSSEDAQNIGSDFLEMSTENVEVKEVEVPVEEAKNVEVKEETKKEVTTEATEVEVPVEEATAKTSKKK